jgi:GT2 family glycosyltransferase
MEAGSNLGYGRANNLGFAAARGRNLLVLNPDTLPMPGSLERLVASLAELPTAGITAPRLLNRDGTLQRSAFRFPTLLMDFLDLFPPPAWAPGRFRAWIAQSRLNGRYPEDCAAGSPFRVDHPLGACLLLRREAFEECGGFDPGIHMYAEEIDLALRYLARGWECWQVPSAEVIHYGGESTSRVPDRMYVELWRSRRYLYRKHYDLVSRFAQATLLASAQLLRSFWTLAQVARGAISRDEARRRWALAGRTLRVVLPV